MKTGESLKFMGGVSVGLDVARENLYDGALMNGDMASFFIVHYIPYALLPSNWSKRNKVYFANSDLYPMVSRKCRNNLLQGEEMTVEKVKELFLSRKGTIPSYLQKLMEAELSVIPIFWENHWMLGLLQMYAPKKGIISGRLVVMDSKFDDERNKHVLKKIAETAHHHLRVAINSGLLLLEKPFQLKNLTLVRCESLPCQDNGVDCGWFMALYAERFVKDMSWMEMSDDEVRFLQLEDAETQAFYERIRNIRREVGTYMEKYTQRCLNFDYDKRAETPPHKAFLFKT